MAEKQITIKLIKSFIGTTDRQRATLRTLGFRRMHQEVTHNASPSILGMIDMMRRWLEVK